MMAESSNADRLLELMGERALFGLDSNEQRELDALADQHPEVQPEEMEIVAAQVELSGLPSAHLELPDHLQRRIRAAMPSGESGGSVSAPAPTTRRDWMTQVATWGGWVTAAALLVALLSRGPQAPGKRAPLVASQARAQLMQAAEDLLRVDWTATEDQAAQGATGDVVWSNAAQEGYMRFVGLAANDTSQSQYQLWIFDTEQDDKYPIDGGVFDIPAGADEVIVPIAAKLDVTRPYMFAITVEKPGGVVVSSRERLPLLAKVEL